MFLKQHNDSSQCQQKEVLNRIVSNSDWVLSHNWVDFFLWKESLYYEISKKHWKDLQVLSDRILFYYLWTQKLLKNEDVKYWFEHAFEVMFTLLDKNIEYIDSLRIKGNSEEIEVVKERHFLW